MQEIVFSPSDFVAVLNQTLQYAYPTVIIEGEISNFKISKNRWVYFDLKDEQASVRFFGTVQLLPGPLQDGLSVRAVGTPRMNPRFGFSVTFQSILPVGEGSLKKAADLLFKKLEAEGLFAHERKRFLPTYPQRIGLVTAADSAASADFIKILNERWSGLEIYLIDVLVQGDMAPTQLVNAIEHMNELSKVPEALVITRGGGSADDLAAFSDERVVRAVAASRIPTLVAIGHEVDVSLAELAADQRASTPSNAAQLLVPDKITELEKLNSNRAAVQKMIKAITKNAITNINSHRHYLLSALENLIQNQFNQLDLNKKLLRIYDPKVALQRGYALVSKEQIHIKSTAQVKPGDELSLQLLDGIIRAVVSRISSNSSGKK